MIRLAIGQLRRRGWRYLSLFFAVFAAVALTVGTVAIVQSLQATVSGMFDKPYQGVSTVAQVRSSGPVDEIFQNIEGDYAFDQQFSSSIKEEGSLYASTTIRSLAEGALQWRTVREGRFPHGPGEIAVVDETPLGTELELKTPGANDLKRVIVVGRVEQSAQEQLSGATALLVDQATAREWAGKTTIGELRVVKQQQLTGKEISEIRSAKAHTTSLANRYLAGRDQYFLLLTAFMVVVAVVAMLVIFSSYSVIAAERRREYGLLRAVGASSVQLQGSAVVEALVLGSIAGILGAPAGLVAARWAGANADSFGVRVPLEHVALETSWLFAIVLAGIAVCVLSALPAARGSVHTPLVDSLVSSAPRSSLLSRALIFLAGIALLITGWSSQSQLEGLKARRALVLSIGTAGIWVLGTMLILAVLLPGLIFHLSRMFDSFPTLQLGMAYVGRQRLRAGSLVAIVLAGSALVSAVLAGQHHIESYLLSKATSKGAVDVAVRSLDNRVDQELVDTLVTAPGVDAGVAPTALPVSFGGTSDIALALSDVEGAPVLREPITAAAPGELILGLNSPLRNVLIDGQDAPVSVRGLEHNLTVRYHNSPETFVDPGTTPTPPAVVRLGVDTRMPRPLVLLRVAGDMGQSPKSEVISSLKGIAAEATEEVAFEEAFSARNDIKEMTTRVLTLSTLMTVVAVLVALVGAMNTVLLMVRERRRDLKLLTAIGLGRGGRRKVLMLELLLLIIPALAAGLALGYWLGPWVAGVVV